MRIFQATSEVPGMAGGEVDRFLESKVSLQLATIDEQGWPNIHPVWYYYDKNEGKFLITTAKLSKKAQNIRYKPSVYFSIHDETKGVKGRGIVTITEDQSKTLEEKNRISMKYLGTLRSSSSKNDIR